MKSLCLAFLLAAAATAFAHQDPAPVKQAVEDYLRIQTKGLSGKTSYTVGAIDPANQLPPCAAFQVSQEAGGRLWGRTTVTVQCQAGAAWSIYVPVHIKIQGRYLVAKKNLGSGQTLVEGDVDVRLGDLTEFPANLLETPEQAYGKTLGVSLAAGQPIRSDALRLPLVIQQGQRVAVVGKGAGFEVSSEGQALNAASEGQVVRVRLSSGQVISGLAKTGGIVEITY